MRKKLFLVAAGIFTLSSSDALGDEPTQLVQEQQLVHGWQLSLSSGYTRLGDRNGHTVGLRGVVMLTDTFGVGLAGNLIGTGDSDLGDDHVRETGMYGGLYFKGVIGSSQMVHSYADLTLGTGGWCERSAGGECDTYDFGVVEPSLNAEVNVAPHVRVALGVGYRQIVDADGPQPDDGLSGVVVRSSLILGQF
jgi:hypothetical protein